MTTIGEKIYSLRSGAGFSQQQLADKLGVSRQSVSKWETGTALPELDKLVAMSELFGVSLDELAGKNDTGNKKKEPNIALVVQKIAGVLLLCASFLCAPVVAIFREFWLVALSVFPMAAASFVLIFSARNTLYKTLAVLMWPISFIFTWGGTILAVSTHATTARIGCAVVFLLLALLYKGKLKNLIPVGVLALMWGVYAVTVSAVTYAFCYCFTTREVYMVLTYLAIEPVLLLMLSVLSIQTIYHIKRKRQV